MAPCRFAARPHCRCARKYCARTVPESTILRRFPTIVCSGFYLARQNDVVFKLGYFIQDRRRRRLTVTVDLHRLADQVRSLTAHDLKHGMDGAPIARTHRRIERLSDRLRLLSDRMRPRTDHGSRRRRPVAYPAPGWLLRVVGDVTIAGEAIEQLFASDHGFPFPFPFPLWLSAPSGRGT